MTTFVRTRLCCREILGGRRTSLHGTALYVMMLVETRWGTFCGLPDVAGNLLRRGALLFHGCGDGRGTLRQLLGRRIGFRRCPSSCLARPGEDRRRRRGAHRQWPFGEPGGPRGPTQLCIVSADQRQQTPPSEGIGPLGQSTNALHLFSAEVLVHHATPQHLLKLPPNVIAVVSVRRRASPLHRSSSDPLRRTPPPYVRRWSTRRCAPRSLFRRERCEPTPSGACTPDTSAAH